MTKALFEIPPQFLKAEVRRQRYLDYLNEHPGSLSTEIVEHMISTFDDDADPFNCLMTMLAHNEVFRTTVGRKHRYTALVKTTVSAIDIRDRRNAAIKTKTNEQHTRESTSTERIVSGKNDSLACARYIHTPSHVHHRGGQGAVRERVWAGTVGVLG